MITKAAYTPPLVDDDYDEYGEIEGRPRPPKESLPTMYDLPAEEEDQPGMPDIYHVWQGRLLDETFRPPNYEPDRIFTATDLNIYYDVHNFSRYERPDWFAVVGLPKPEQPVLRMSYVIWQEELSPVVAVELLSPSTEKNDLGRTLRDVSSKPTKWDAYEHWLKIPNYIVFNGQTNELRVFELSTGRYQQVLNHGGRWWIETVGLGLGLWHGSYLRHERFWLRWYDRDGNWLLNSEEQTELERQRAEQERRQAEQARRQTEQAQMQAGQAIERAERAEQRADQERRRAEQLAARLRALGIDPEQI
ncbi:MAG TPA: Uma2 family endonuclease [Blastocatellia bacterium]|nr:Uma2 family endonuclease [Blastocatellia bacterium]HMV87456.1 Uma2 family endonuclease [Blastocatellia bacterium]HMX26355.1 Uma2 family endonuclease [Blastocatellia bacterium]HMY71900.1 Uma2 family endonuclease [Blastocatellia bacterium]HMZ20552.1 Uma2 family endonuclease [Blastocatellia bacterium]